MCTSFRYKKRFKLPSFSFLINLDFFSLVAGVNVTFFFLKKKMFIFLLKLTSVREHGF